MKKDKTRKKSKKWNPILFCHAKFNTKGILEIYRNGKVFASATAIGELSNAFYIIKYDRQFIYYNHTPFQTFRIRKKFCKII